MGKCRFFKTQGEITSFLIIRGGIWSLFIIRGEIRSLFIIRGGILSRGIQSHLGIFAGRMNPKL